MENNRLENIKFEYKDKQYEFGFTLEEVKQISTLSNAKQGNIKDVEFLKIALSKYSKAGFITNRVVEEIQQGLASGIETQDGDYLTYQELTAYLFALFSQAIDDAARELEPAIVEINKDNTVKITVDDEAYKLMFNRNEVLAAIEDNTFDFNSILELYTAGSAIIRAALQHYKRRFSVNLHNHIFLSLWATKFDKETEDDLMEVINALTFHMGEVVESGGKNSKAAFKVTMR